MLHSDILPEQGCDGELIELPEDVPTSRHFAECARCGTEFTFVPGQTRFVGFPRFKKWVRRFRCCQFLSLAPCIVDVDAGSGSHVSETSSGTDARSLGVSDVLAIDDDGAIAKFRLVDAIADTVGGEVAAKLIAKVKLGGCFGYTAVLPESAAALNPTVKIARVLAQPDPSKVREFADDVRDGKFVLPIGRRMPLHHAAEAHVLGEKGGIGKILLLMPDSSD